MHNKLMSGRGVIYLAACAIHGKCPEQDAVMGMQLEYVYKQATKHAMQAITYMAIAKYTEKYGTDGLDAELLKKWKYAYERIVHRLVLLDIERERVIRHLEASGIWYMPLKGAILQNYYPKLGMRQMSDNDILVDAGKRQEIYDFMTESGYEAVYFALEHPDTYQKNNKQFYFEMHHSLFFNVKRSKEAYDYYKDVKKRLIKKEGTEYGYCFKNEDFYVYIVTHSYKHFTECGVGIRSLMDSYVYRRAMSDKLDKEYVAKELEALGLTNFERVTSTLADILFGKDFSPPEDIDKELSDSERQMLNVHILSGTFGTAEQSIAQLMKTMDAEKKITLGARIKYLFRRFFPDMDYYKINHPTVYKYKILVPFYWFWRLIRGVFRSPRVNAREMKYIWKSK